MDCVFDQNICSDATVDFFENNFLEEFQDTEMNMCTWCEDVDIFSVIYIAAWCMQHLALRN